MDEDQLEEEKQKRNREKYPQQQTKSSKRIYRLSDIIWRYISIRLCIDIRAVLGKSKQDKSWYCIILKARLTREDIVETEKMQREMRICHVDKDRFKIAFESRPIDQVDIFLNEVEQGQR
jgi:hypothetical protein